MVLKIKKKRKIQRVEPKLEIDGEPSQHFSVNTSLLDYRDRSGEIRDRLQAIVKDS